MIYNIFCVWKLCPSPSESRREYVRVGLNAASMRHALSESDGQSVFESVVVYLAF